MEYLIVNVEYLIGLKLCNPIEYGKLIIKKVRFGTVTN